MRKCRAVLCVGGETAVPYYIRISKYDSNHLQVKRKTNESIDLFRDT